MDKTKLLIDAALAAGYEIKVEPPNVFINGRGNWNPIEADADAFRLMVDCGIDVALDDECVDADGWLTIYFSGHNNDKHAATRMAIVRAAAQSSGKEE